MEILISPQLSAVLVFSQGNKKVTFIQLSAAERKPSTVVCVCALNSRLDSLAFLKSVSGALQRAPSGDSVVLLGDFNAHVV